MKKIALLSLSVFLLTACSMGGIPVKKAEKISADFIEILAPGAEITIKSVEKVAGGDFKITVDANKQEIISFLSPDGSTFYPQGLDIVDLTAKAADFKKTQEATGDKTPVEAEEKVEAGTAESVEVAPTETEDTPAEPADKAEMQEEAAAE